MKLYTKQGDDGTTGLFGRGRVPKSHVIIHLLGELDELNASLGVAQAMSLPSLICQDVDWIQNTIFDFGAEVASWRTNDETSSEASSGKDLSSTEGLGDKCVGKLEGMIDAVDQQNDPLREFILPGGSVAASQIHLSRAICRRVERCLVDTLTHVVPIANETHIRAWINRLSDYLFAAARLTNKLQEIEEVKWRKRSGEES